MIAIKRILFDNFTQVNGENCAKKRNKNTKRSTKIIIKNYTWQKSTSPKSPYQRKKVYSQFEKKSRNNFYGKLKSSSKIPWSAKIICNLKKNEHKKVVNEETTVTPATKWFQERMRIPTEFFCWIDNISVACFHSELVLIGHLWEWNECDFSELTTLALLTVSFSSGLVWLQATNNQRIKIENCHKSTK